MTERDALRLGAYLKWLKDNPDKAREMRKRRNDQVRDEVLAHYGTTCSCCGEAERRFLTIDHVHNDGAEHRAIFGTGGSNLYYWLRRNNYPPGFQTLCWNCNSGRYLNGGVCPHQELKDLTLDSFTQAATKVFRIRVDDCITSPHLRRGAKETQRKER